MTKFAMVVASIALAGCAPNYMWVRDGTTQQEFEQDRQRCIYEANLATASYSQGATARTTSGAIAQGIGEGLTMSMRQAELGVMCMKSKGYTQRAIVPQQTTYTAAPAAAPAAAAAPYTGGRLVDCGLPDGSSRMLLLGDCYVKGGRERETTPVAAPTQPAQIGTFSFEAEKVAKTENCSSTPVAKLTAKGPGFESFNVPCSNGDALAIRCDTGNCRVLK